MASEFALVMAGAAAAHQAAAASRQGNGQQGVGRGRRSSGDPKRAQRGATAAAAAAPAALDSLSRLQQLADASPQVAQLRRLQALADASPQMVQMQRLQAPADSYYATVSQLAGVPEEKELLQGQFASAELQPQLQQAPRANKTGLPDQLKSGIESLSGLSMDHVRVHYNSSQPAQLNALAYAQGSDIHLAPGQERHLPHEAWHVVQQAQGRVKPTMQAKGMPINDNQGLEKEAHLMGKKALSEVVQRVGKPKQNEETRLYLLATPTRVAQQPLTIQRQVRQIRQTAKQNADMYYSTFDEKNFFKNKEEAEKYDEALRLKNREQQEENKNQAREAKRNERKRKHEEVMKNKFKNYQPPESKTARLFIKAGKDSAVVKLFKLNSENIKEYSGKIFAERKSGIFTTQVISMGREYYVLTPGTDIGLVRAILKPEWQKGHEHTPLMREGTPQTYSSLASSLDKIADKNNKDIKDIKEVRVRMGKDIDRLTRTHDAEGSIKYNSDELQAMKELAAVLRLDKGRVPNATKYIRKSITSGKYSFHDLFVKNKYVGAGQGGVQALRGMASEDGYESTGSDIEEKPKKKKQKIEKPSMDKDAKSNSDSNSGTHIRGMGRGRRGGARAATYRKSQSAKGDEKSSAQGSNEQALDAKKSEKPELAIMAEDEVEDYILNSVKSRM